MQQSTFNKFMWSVFAGSIILPFTAWASRYDWQILDLTGYQYFPLLGLLAWMIMWGHYVSGAIIASNKHLEKPHHYRRISGYVVLAALVLHPGILALTQYQNDAGLPPESFTSFTGDGLLIAVFLGMIGLAIFLSYEVFDRIRNNLTVKKYWWVVSISQSLAMVLIFVHALRLGGDLGAGWFQVVWWLYGLVLITCFYIIHKAEFSRTHAQGVE